MANKITRCCVELLGRAYFEFQHSSTNKFLGKYDNNSGLWIQFPGTFVPVPNSFACIPANWILHSSKIRLIITVSSGNKHSNGYRNYSENLHSLSKVFFMMVEHIWQSFDLRGKICWPFCIGKDTIGEEKNGSKVQKLHSVLFHSFIIVINVHFIERHYKKFGSQFLHYSSAKITMDMIFFFRVFLFERMRIISQCVAYDERATSTVNFFGRI